MRWLAGAVAAMLAIGAFVSAAGSDEPAPDHIRLSLNSTIYTNLPLFLAIDNGYFTQQHLDVAIVPFTGSSVTQLPYLARGEIDISNVAPAPGLFNLPEQGFNVKVVASLSGAHAGWNGASWLVVRQDLWDAKTIRKPADLRGMHVDVAAEGAPTDLLAHEVIRQAGLTPADVNVTAAVHTPANWYSSLRNHAVDVQLTVEPTATELQREGLGHKWLSYADATPWFQDVYFAVSPSFARDHHDAIRRFLIAYLRAAQDVDRAGPAWTPKMAAEVAKWTQLPLATIMQVPGPAYAGQLGTVNVASLERVQAYWVSQGLVKTAEPLSDLLDLTALEEARKALHIR
ncbi:MAG: ABC transporter substrate-binding protein [Candidatus Lustribacter sp.]